MDKWASHRTCILGKFWGVQGPPQNLGHKWGNHRKFEALSNPDTYIYKVRWLMCKISQRLAVNAHAMNHQGSKLKSAQTAAVSCNVKTMAARCADH